MLGIHNFNLKVFNINFIYIYLVFRSSHNSYNKYVTKKIKLFYHIISKESLTKDFFFIRNNLFITSKTHINYVAISSNEYIQDFQELVHFIFISYKLYDNNRIKRIFCIFFQLYSIIKVLFFSLKFD